MAMSCYIQAFVTSVKGEPINIYIKPEIRITKAVRYRRGTDPNAFSFFYFSYSAAF